MKSYVSTQLVARSRAGQQLRVSTVGLRQTNRWAGNDPLITLAESMEKRELIALPQYIDPEAWAGFEEMRKLIKKPMTDRARKLIVYELDRIRKAGHCVNAALDQSTQHCWADVFVPQEKPIQAATSSDAERTTRYLAEQSKKVAVTVDVRGMLGAAKANIRRVA
jgi:hypothetical protein